MASDSLTVYLVRHGITTWNREMRMQGHTDVDLDPEGLLQAAAIASRLAQAFRVPEAVYSSDLKRARFTAEAIAGRLNLQVITNPMLRETCLGEWEGLTQEEIAARGDAELLDRYRKDPYNNRPPNSETMDEVWERMEAVYRQIVAAHSGGCVAIVGHGGSLRSIICQALNAPITSMKHIWLSNASLTSLEVSGEDAHGDRFQRVNLLNDTSHLAPEM